MLDIQYIRDNQDELKAAIKNKQFDPSLVDQLLKIDQTRRNLISKVEAIRGQSNQLDQQIKSVGKPSQEQIAQGKDLKTQLKQLEPELKIAQAEFTRLMLSIPNPAAADVPIGKDESGNQEIFKWGEIPQFDFKPRSHEELASSLNLYDSQRAVRIAGSRAYFLKGDLVLLEQAILRYAIDSMVSQGFSLMSVPWMVNDSAMSGTGYFPWGKDDHYFTQDGDHLIGTSEVSLTAYHMGEMLNEKDLPIKMVGISPCFRREVGGYGKDTKGFIRVHTFTKVEQVVYTIADEAATRQMHDQMRDYSEQILKDLNLPYHVLLMCTGDMGAGQRKKYDIETRFPSQNKYRETHSDSYFKDFQARRLNIRYQAKDGSVKHVYTLNNTVAATPRLLAAVIENYQTKDGQIRVPQALRAYINKELIEKLT